MVDLFGFVSFLFCFGLAWFDLFGWVWFVEFVLLVGWMFGCWVVLFSGGLVIC